MPFQIAGHVAGALSDQFYGPTMAKRVCHSGYLKSCQKSFFYQSTNKYIYLVIAGKMCPLIVKEIYAKRTRSKNVNIVK